MPNRTARLGLTVHRSGGQSYQQVTVAFFYRLPDNKLKEMGGVLVEPMLPDTTRPVSVTWNTAGLAGAVTVVAVIDPEQKVTESTKNNNSVSRTVALIARDGRRAAPTIQSLTVNSGAARKPADALGIHVTFGASDSGGSGLATVYLADAEYHTVAGEWVTIQSTGSIGWQDSIPFILSGHGGTRYIQVWVADQHQGNIAQGRVRIDYLPASDSVLQNQVHVYRRTLDSGPDTQRDLANSKRRCRPLRLGAGPEPREQEHAGRRRRRPCGRRGAQGRWISDRSGWPSSNRSSNSCSI